MGSFYRYQPAQNKHLMLYSERGLLSYLFHHVMLDDPADFLREAKNQSGQSLLQTLPGPIADHRVFTEFDLGAAGFGCPDGALLAKCGDQRTFVFIEGKAVPFDVSFQDPSIVAARIAHVDWDQIDLESLVRENSFNSSINGQLELKWRFVNALLAMLHGHYLVSEDHVILPIAILQSDRFYWRHRLKPVPKKKGHWRRVEMGTDLRPLHDELATVQDFRLLCITADEAFPARLGQVRRFARDGDLEADSSSRLFWLPLRFIQDRLERLA